RGTTRAFGERFDGDSGVDVKALVVPGSGFEGIGALARTALAGPTLILLCSALFAAPPKVNYLYPAGAQRGQSVVVTAAGDFSTWPVQVWLDRPGVSFAAEKDKGKFKVGVASDAGAGIYWVRMHNADGAAALRPFVVGTLPEVMENETNDLPDK